MKHIFKIITPLLMLFICGTITAEDNILSPDAKISLLTCAPGTEIYELFGHSGLRVYDKEKAIDVTFNYGVFDFYQDNFIIRFVRGKTDYFVEVSSTEDFLSDYATRGSGVTENVLNLTQDEKIALWVLLMDNIRPENSTYRYNFIFNNCATKLRDLIEQNIEGKLTYPDVSGSGLSFRDAIMLYTETSPWSQLGFDLCLGRGLDRETTPYEKMFLPEILGNTVSQATVIKADTTINLTLERNTIIENKLQNPEPWMSPLTLGIILCILVAALSIYAIIKHLNLRWFDAILFSVNGLFGCLILFLILFSKHPFTGANFNIIWLNPFMGIPLVFAIFKSLHRYEKFYYMIVSVVLTLFLLGSFALEQEFNPAIYPFIVIYLIRSVSYVTRWGYKLN